MNNIDELQIGVRYKVNNVRIGVTYLIYLGSHSDSSHYFLDVRINNVIILTKLTILNSQMNKVKNSPSYYKIVISSKQLKAEWGTTPLESSTILLTYKFNLRNNELISSADSSGNWWNKDMINLPCYINPIQDAHDIKKSNRSIISISFSSIHSEQITNFIFPSQNYF